MAEAIEAIAVTGVGLVTPLGSSREAVWRAFTAGESGIRELADGDPRRDRGADPSPLAGARRAGWVQGFQPRESIRSPHLRRMDWGSRMLVAAARQAFEDADLLPLEEAVQESAAIVVGSCFGNQRETATYLEKVFTAGFAAGQPFLFPNLVLNAAGGYAAIEIGAQGPNLSVSEHEASGEAALVTAVDLLRAGACEVACAGGFDELGDVFLEALIERRRLHPGSRPADGGRIALSTARGRHGALIPGEGAAMLLLEPAGRAAQRGARVYAVIACAKTAAAAASPYGFPRDLRGAAARLVAIALGGGRERGNGGREGGAHTGDVSLVLGSDDGSRQRAGLDAAVLAALAARQAIPPAYVAFRRQTGDWGAAGALGAALAALALHRGSLDPVAPDTNDAASSGAAEIRRVLLVGAGRSGVLAPLVLERAGDPELGGPAA